MAMKLYSDTDIQAIADAIRGKNGSSDTYKVSEMADAIDDIPTGGGSSLPASCKFYARVTPTTDASSSNKLFIDAPIVSNWAMMVFAVDTISPPETGYIALGRGVVHFINTDGYGAILRANGTQGNDNTQTDYDSATGKIKLGGSYGIFLAGKSYDVYLFEHGGVNV